MPEQQNFPPEMSQRFADLIFLALDHAIDSVSGGGPLIPFVIYEQSEKRSLSRYAADTLEEGLRQARLAAAALPTSVEFCAMVYDGFVTVEGRKVDAILVEASERGKDRGVCFAQRYSPKKFIKPFRTIGNALFLRECDSLIG